MNTQKIQSRGFTLVELIVVITILVILGTIAFINLGGQSAGARDAKRTSDVRNLVSQVNIKQISGVNIIDMIATGATYQIGSTVLSIAGTGLVSGDYGVNYTAGTPNFAILALSPDNFKDATTKNDYAMAGTKIGGSEFQIAATMENDNAKTALVMGNFNARKTSDTASGTIGGVSGAYTLTLATGLGLFNKGDWIKSTGATPGTGSITNISSDLKTITISTTTSPTSGVAFVLATPETLGLIKATKNAAGADVSASNLGVVNGSGAVLPY